jgi:translation elongation factor EF-4
LSAVTVYVSALIVIAFQGIQAQTLSVLEEARKRKLKVVGAVNKWDLVKDDGRGEAAVRELSALLECEEDEILRVSAKTGLGVESVLEGVVARIPPPPPVVPGEKLRALAFDSYYDSFRGVVSLVAVVEGEIKKGQFLPGCFAGYLFMLILHRRLDHVHDHQASLHRA